jgi:hypothetical protein
LDLKINFSRKIRIRKPILARPIPRAIVIKRGIANTNIIPPYTHNTVRAIARRKMIRYTIEKTTIELMAFVVWVLNAGDS